MSKTELESETRDRTIRAALLSAGPFDLTYFPMDALRDAFALAQAWRTAVSAEKLPSESGAAATVDGSPSEPGGD